MRKKSTTGIFIERAIATYGEKFDYSKVVYRGCDKKVVIICRVHGEFFQIPSEHLRRNGGCRKCYFESKKLSLEDFTLKSTKIHGNKYDYSKVTYRGSGVKVCIVCPIHGEFWQRPYSHFSGNGCSDCGDIATAKGLRLSHDEFVKKSMEMHSDKYNYSNSKYIDNRTKVHIVCKIHGDFLQKPNDHLLGRGCPRCNCSRGEESIRKWLIRNRIEFNHYHNYSDLRGLSNRPLEFDFYIPFKNLLIEFDGEQHYRPIKFGGISIERATEEFKNIVRNDFLKNSYCFKNNIPLLRIPYNRFKEISEILTENLQIGNMEVS